MFPRLYPIIDATRLAGSEEFAAFAQELISGGAIVLQYRNKKGSAREILSQARSLKVLVGDRVRLVMNDRADLCLGAGFDGVHVGQDDLSPDAARAIVKQGKWVGASTHNMEQALAADASSADYIAIGPIFATQSKERPDPVVGLEGLKKVRAAIGKPLVAIGGISLSNCRSVVDAGADSVAVVSALIASPAKTVEDFIRILR